MNVAVAKDKAYRERLRLMGICYDSSGTVRNNLYALELYQNEIAQHCAADVSVCSTTDRRQTTQLVQSDRPDILFLCPEWSTDCDEAQQLIDALRQVHRGSIVLVDFCDGTNSPFFNLLPAVDLFIKAHLLRDLLAYRRELAGGTVFTDFLVNQLGWDLEGWYFGSRLDSDHADKLRAGWTWGVHDRYRRLAKLASLVDVPWALRRIDLNTRFGGAQNGTGDWYCRYRHYALEAVRGLTAGMRLSGNQRVGFKRYLAELMISKISFSPFGWGEVCYRDFETIACGALLMKPDMDHLQTHPNLYRPFETYVPVKWDLSDLEEKTRYYLAHPSEARQIAAHARRKFKLFYSQRQFVQLLQSHLAALSANRPC